MSSAQWSSDLPLNVGGSKDDEWLTGLTLSIPKRSPTNFWQCIGINDSGTGENYGTCYPSDTWNTVDVSHWVPAATKAVRLDGLIILTHPSLTEIAEVNVAFRKNGETYDFPYILQTIDVYNSGQRSNGGLWVCLDADYKFQFKWKKQGTGSHGMGLRITACAG